MWIVFLAFWSELGWFANFLTIVLGLYSVYQVLMVQWKFIAKRFCAGYVYSDVYSYLEAKQCKKFNKFSKSVVIVDDNPENCAVDYLRNVGYQIQVIESISLSDISQLYNYELIILDITGIVIEDPVKWATQVSINSERMINRREGDTFSEKFKDCNADIKAIYKCSQLLVKSVGMIEV